MWDISGPGVELIFPARAGGFFTTEPPGKPLDFFKLHFFLLFIPYLFFSYHLLIYLDKTEALMISDTLIFNYLWMFSVGKKYLPFPPLFYGSNRIIPINFIE